MRVKITDDFSLDKIADSGQCFRVRKFPADSEPEMVFRFITREHILYISEKAPMEYEVSCSQEEWGRIWFPYFDLCTDYAAIRTSIPTEDTYLRTAAEAAKGIRILRQDPWEMLITFIISQRKSIPAIKGNVEQISAAFGTLIRTDYEDVYLFPTPEQMAKKEPMEGREAMEGKKPTEGKGQTDCDADPHDILQSCRLGYRLPYVEDAIRKVYTRELDPAFIATLPDGELFERLKTVKGVGDKVANCVCLFGYHRTSNAPVDVWIKRAIDEHYKGVNPLPGYGEHAGIMQQFLFYYALATK